MHGSGPLEMAVMVVSTLLTNVRATSRDYTRTNKTRHRRLQAELDSKLQKLVVTKSQPSSWKLACSHRLRSPTRHFGNVVQQPQISAKDKGTPFIRQASTRCFQQACVRRVGAADDRTPTTADTQ